MDIRHALGVIANFYQQALTFDLKNHKIYLDGNSIEQLLIPEQFNAYELVEEIYPLYYNTAPMRSCNSPIPAKAYNELEYMDFGTTHDRLTMNNQLLTTIVLGALAGCFDWERGFYWQSKKYENLILYKDWCVVRGDLKAC